MSVRAVGCPCCWKTLYKVVTKSGDSRIEGPEIQEDGKGTFMRCEHCQARIAVTKVPDMGVLAPAVAPNQHAGVGYLPFIE